jgi:hypothetical protein
MADYVEGPRPFVITDDDRRGLIAIFTTLLLIWMLLCYMIRLYLRLSPRLPLGWDDAALTVATAFAVIQSAVVYVQVSDGYGETLRMLSLGRVRRIEKADAASTIFYLFTLALTKASVAFLLARMTRDKSHLRACRATAIASAAWLVLSILVVFPGCGIHPWRGADARCSNQYPRWIFVAITDVFTDLALLGLPLYLVWSLQTTVRRKAVVVFAFAFRIPVIIVALLRLHYLYRTIHGPDPTLAGATSSIYTQFEINLGLMAASIPCAKPFIQAFYTGYLTHQVPESVLRDTHLGPYALSDLPSSGKSNGTSPMPSISGPGKDPITEPKPVAFKADVSANISNTILVDDDNASDDNADAMAIRQTTAWSVRYHAPGSSGVV